MVYWSLFLVPTIGALFEVEGPKGAKPTFVLLLSFLFLVIAFRETGGDYSRYLVLSDLIEGMSFSEAVEASDPLYGALNWLSNLAGFGLYGVNVVCALIFLYGFARFCAPESRSLLMLASATSYLVIVVVIGYTRQGTAIGLEFLALRALMARRLFPYLAWIVVAAGFHRSAAILLPLGYLAAPAHSGWSRKLSGGATVLGALILIAIELSGQADTFIQNYLQSGHYESQGAFVRSFMSVAAATLFLFNQRKWATTWGDRDIWLVFAIAAFAIFAFSVEASTAADRMGLYIIPLQIIVFARLPSLMQSARVKNLFVVGTIGAYGFALGVWLHLGQFAGVLWLPYSSLLVGTIP